MDLLQAEKIIISKKAGLVRLFLYTLVLLTVISCEEKNGGNTPELRHDYYPQKINLKYAEGFRVKYFKSYKLLEIFSGADSTRILKRYLLVEQGTRAPEHSPEDVVIKVPVFSMSCLSTTHVPYIAALGKIENISGIGHPETVLDTILKKQIREGWTLGITSSGQPDAEKILEANTAILMAYPFDQINTEALSRFNIPVVYAAEYLEHSALARAEWIKFFALFFNREKQANRIFGEIEKRYLNAQKEIEKNAAGNRPGVFFGSYYQDVWYAPGGGSLMSGLIGDAGGNYLFAADPSTGNLTIDREVIMEKLKDINYWGQIFTSEQNPVKNDFMGGDPRLLSRAQQIPVSFFYVNSQKSDYFGKASLEPDVLLKDLANIFRPGLLPNHDFVYFHPAK